MRLAETHVVSQQEVRKKLPIRISGFQCGVRFGGDDRRNDIGLDRTARNCVQETAESSMIVSCQLIFVLSIERVLTAEFHRVASTSPRHVASKVVLVREVVVRPELGQRAKTIAR